MNYLAHAFLSFGNAPVLVGNMISDFVKGKKKLDYPLSIQKGIQLHRAIDAFTDAHEATKEAKEFFRPTYRLYAGAFVDVVYDHFLATDDNEFTDAALSAFAISVYKTLGEYQKFLPEKFAGMFPYMQSQNWLYNYQYKWGIEKSMGGVVRRSVYLTESETAFGLFEKNFEALKVLYLQFWPELKDYARLQFEMADHS